VVPARLVDAGVLVHCVLLPLSCQHVACPKGMYASGNSCKRCDKNFYCPGGGFDGLGAPEKVPCPADMVTLGGGSPSSRSCGEGGLCHWGWRASQLHMVSLELPTRPHALIIWAMGFRKGATHI
jgi:hypothetical protein